MNFAMYSEVDVFISNYTLLDPEVYQLWIDGCSSSEAVKQLHKRGVTQETGASYDLLSSDVADHYRTYSLLERLLHNPPKLAEQISFQLEPETKQFLIERYYEIDDAVIRELLGKKLSSRHRKDLDEVSDKTKVHLKSCRRQFDNVKRVYKAVEEMQGSVVTNIQTNFLLSQELAEKYGAVVFIGCMRFETSKRKLQYLTFSDFLHCARILMDKWTYRCNKEPDGAAMDDTDLDREFLLDMRELRTLLEKEKEHKQTPSTSPQPGCSHWEEATTSQHSPINVPRPLSTPDDPPSMAPCTEVSLVCQKLKPQLLERSYVELELNFRTYTRALVGMACGLHRGRERVRSFFLDMVERCIEPWKQVAWSRVDLSHFLDAYTSSALEMDVLREPELKNAWERYMAVMSSCLLRLFHS